MKDDLVSAAQRLQVAAEEPLALATDTPRERGLQLVRQGEVDPSEAARTSLPLTASSLL